MSFPVKMTLYRLAKQSKVIEALIEAAENGKEVVVLVVTQRPDLTRRIILNGPGSWKMRDVR